jgi:sterol desaturase/sphingolipid hydroxylase (fatty acid hydroxylase superfamily)
LDAGTVQICDRVAGLPSLASHRRRARREKNFAATFPLLDLMFGTFYMPKGELPDSYGIADKEFPAGFGAQLAYPFKSRPEVAQTPAPAR